MDGELSNAPQNRRGEARSGTVVMQLDSLRKVLGLCTEASLYQELGMYICGHDLIWLRLRMDCSVRTLTGMSVSLSLSHGRNTCKNK